MKIINVYFKVEIEVLGAHMREAFWWANNCDYLLLQCIHQKGVTALGSGISVLTLSPMESLLSEKWSPQHPAHS